MKLKKIALTTAASLLVLVGAVTFLPLRAIAGLESPCNYISDLVATNPLSSDLASTGDDHMRCIKLALKTTFPNVNGAVTSTDEELNIVDGVTSSAAELNLLDGITGTVWSSGNDGSGSGLDADLLDGNSSAAFPILATATNTFSGTTNGNRGITLSNASNGASANGYFEVANDAGRSLLLRLTSTGYSGSIITNSPTGEHGVLYTAGAVGLSLGTNGTERMRILSDGSVINMTATAVQVNTISITPTTGSFTATLTGMTAGTTGTVFYRCILNTCTLSTGTSVNILGTSNANTLTMTGVPAAAQSTSGVCDNTITVNNGTAAFGSYCLSGGTMTFSIQNGTTSASSSGFTSSGNKGLSNWTVTYSTL